MTTVTEYIFEDDMPLQKLVSGELRPRDTNFAIEAAT